MNSIRTPTGYLRQSRHKTPHGPSWREYESAKAAWVVNHPEATPAHYSAAMTRIARECGV